MGKVILANTQRLTHVCMLVERAPRTQVLSWWQFPQCQIHSNNTTMTYTYNNWLHLVCSNLMPFYSSYITDKILTKTDGSCSCPIKEQVQLCCKHAEHLRFIPIQFVSLIGFDSCSFTSNESVRSCTVEPNNIGLNGA